VRKPFDYVPYSSEFGELQDTLTMLLIDNQSALRLPKTPPFHACTKHIAIWHHFLWEKVCEWRVKLGDVLTGDQVADVLTKGLNERSTNVSSLALGIHWHTCLEWRVVDIAPRAPAYMHTHACAVPQGQYTWTSRSFY